MEIRVLFIYFVFKVDAMILNRTISTVVTTAVGSLMYALFWDKMTSLGLIAGSALSAASVIIAWTVMNTLRRLNPNFSIGKLRLALNQNRQFH